MKIPFVDLKAQYLLLKDEIDSAMESVIFETAFIGGKYVENFEKEFSSLYGVNHCIGVANGTDSLYIIMKMLGITIGDEVIVPVNTWISSSETITQTGAKPIFVDIDDYYSIDASKIEEKITSCTKAIIAVHLQGQMCAIEKIADIANKNHLHLIEDCAQSHFSTYKSRNAGLFGIAGSFSFFPGKNLGAYGDAGCIITNDEELALKCRMYARHGALKKHEHQIEGINSRLDGLQAAILSVKLRYILEWTRKRQEAASLYSQKLKNIGDIQIPLTRENTTHSFHLYVIRTSFRDELKEFLQKNKIECAIHYPRILSNLPAYKYLNHSFTDFPVANQYQNEILSLPIYPEITEEQIEYISGIIKLFFEKQAPLLQTNNT